MTKYCASGVAHAVIHLVSQESPLRNGERSLARTTRSGARLRAFHDRLLIVVRDDDVRVDGGPERVPEIGQLAYKVAAHVDRPLDGFVVAEMGAALPTPHDVHYVDHHVAVPTEPPPLMKLALTPASVSCFLSRPASASSPRRRWSWGWRS